MRRIMCCDTDQIAETGEMHEIYQTYLATAVGCIMRERKLTEDEATEALDAATLDSPLKCDSGWFWTEED